MSNARRNRRGGERLSVSMRRRACSAAVVAAATALTAAVAPAGAAHKRPPALSWVKCYRLCSDTLTVAPGGTIKLAGRRFGIGVRVVFKVKTAGGRLSVRAQRLGSTRLLARVPPNARSGSVYVRAAHGVRTNRAGPLRIRRLGSPRPPAEPAPPPSGSPFDGDAMWIWNLPRSDGGSPARILARARARGIETVFVKSGDGTNYWEQFSPALVQALEAGGLRVCGWQYVYGRDPTGEAAVAAAAARAGADCFIIDAEKEYEGRYAQAQTYVRALRRAVGASYPIGLSSFPYVDFHPALPYSEFLAPGGAQFNVPQIYWKAIGDPVTESFEHTYRFNRPYATAIAPAGQAYNSPRPADIVRFRQLVRAAGSTGISWWSWESSGEPAWQAIGAELGPFTGRPPAADLAPLSRGARGDLVVWAQRHLRAAGHSVRVDGAFGAAMENAVRAFRSANGLPAAGEIDTFTWLALTARHDPAPQRWRRTGVTAARGRAVTGPAKSAGLRAKRYEIP